MLLITDGTWLKTDPKVTTHLVKQSTRELFEERS